MDAIRVRSSENPAKTHRLLTIYLSDHLAGAAAGTALAGRIVRRQSGTDMESDARWLDEQIAADKQSLEHILEQLRVRPARYKMVAAKAAERASRVKLNGFILRRSPLSTLVELEAMVLAIYGKRCGWQGLRALADHVPQLDKVALDELIARADQQITLLERLRREAVVRAFGAARDQI